jgi:hypothetical protein
MVSLCKVSKRLVCPEFQNRGQALYMYYILYIVVVTQHGVQPRWQSDSRCSPTPTSTGAWRMTPAFERLSIEEIDTVTLSRLQGT